MYTLLTIGMLIVSNVFMTFAWYAHLKDLNAKPWIVAALVSWGIALAEYLIMVPANRIGHTQAGLSLWQLKIIQEVITLTVFVPFAVFYMRLRLDYNFLIAGAMMIGAVVFVMRGAGAQKPVERATSVATDVSR
jgi:uncharacterized protein